MNEKQPKKMMILDILEILRRYTDEEHRLSQREITVLLQKEYGMEADRKSVKRNLMDLKDFGYDIEYTATPRLMPKEGKDPEENLILSDFYLARDITEGELRLLMCSLAFSRYLSHGQCQELLKKLMKNLASEHFVSALTGVYAGEIEVSKNKEIFLTIETLCEAIRLEKKVSFTYNRYDTDKQLHPMQDEEGQPKQYLINPYYIVMSNERYYLICNKEGHDNLANYRLDRIKDVTIEDMPVKSKEDVQDMGRHFNTARYMAEHIYMMDGESVVVTFRLHRKLISEVIDRFGSGVRFLDTDGEQITAEVTVNRKAMRRWAVENCSTVKLLTPADLAEEVRQELRQGLALYDEE